MFAAHLIRLLPGLPAVLFIGYALKNNRDRLHPFVWLLAAVTAGAPLAIGYVWARNPVGGLLYALLTYASVWGFYVRLTREHLPFRYSRLLLFLFMASAVTAFVVVPVVVLPTMHDMTVAIETEEGNPDLQIQEALRDVDAALAKIEIEQQNLHQGVRTVVEHIRMRSARIHELQERRDKIMDDLQRLEPLKDLTAAQIARLTEEIHKSQWRDNVISFLIGIASSITAALALKFFWTSS